jgi:hypothetical protein
MPALVRGSVGRLLAWVSTLGGIAAACGSSSDLDVAMAGSGGAAAATPSGGTSSRAGASANWTGGTRPFATGGACSSPCALGNCCSTQNSQCVAGSLTCLCTNGVWNPCSISHTGGVPPVATGGAHTGGRATGGKATGGMATGGSPPALAPACSALCATTQHASLAACQYDVSVCNVGCTGYMDDPIDPENYPPMVRCLASLTASQWQCSSDPTDGTMFGAVPAANGPCESLICGWTCTDATLVDASAYYRCLC